MKISNSTPNYINQTYSSQTGSTPAGQNASQPQGPDAEQAPADSINLSGKTRDLQKISRAMETEPAERQKYVADIKQQVENNTYNVNAEQVAEKMVGLFMDDMG